MERRDLTGTTIAGRYRVLRKLGSGGMGAVWLAQHLESLQQYALKTLHAHVASDKLAVERFLREARAAAALRSKHVVKVVDAQMGHVDEQTREPMPFIVMELLEGANLEELIHVHTRLPPEQAVWVLRGVARALDVAHQKGIVHRDLKPENVFIAIDDEGEPVPKVCDFGIAKLASDAAGLMSSGALGTQTGMTVGTPMYMSPEQARSSSDVGVESDQWAVGLIAFKALTGREYFSTARSTTELLLKIVNDPLEPPSTRYSELPPAFDAWFFKSCSRDPKARFPSAGEQIVALGDALSVSEPRPPVVHRSERVLATAETVSAVESQLPISPIQATTGAPASRTMAEPATMRAKPAKKPRLFVVLAAFAVSAVLGFVLIARKPSAPAPAAPATTSAAPTIEKTIAPPPPPPTIAATPVPTPSVSVTAIVPPSKTKPIAKPTATVSATTPIKTSTKLPKGAACARSNECASGFCVSEECQ